MIVDHMRNRIIFNT